MLPDAPDMLSQIALALIVVPRIDIIDKCRQRHFRVQNNILMVRVVKYHIGNHLLVGVLIADGIAILITDHLLQVVLFTTCKAEALEQQVEFHLTKIALHLRTAL